MGGEWHVDANRDQLMTVTNGGNRAAEALLTLHYDNGTKKYEIQRSIQPGDQTWINIGDLIHGRVPDRSGNFLPADITYGTYDLRALGYGPGSLLIASASPDKISGNQVHPPLPECCATTTALQLTPSDITIGPLGASLDGRGYDVCTQQGFDLYSYVNSWISGNSSIASVTPGAVHGVAPGATYTEVDAGPFFEGYGTNCHLVDVFPTTPVAVFSIQITDADIENNAVNVTLSGPSGRSGILVVTAIGGKNKVQVSANGGNAIGPGSYHVAFNRPSMPADTYKSLTAQWSVDATPFSSTFTLSRNWIVVGTIRHSQYNTVYEATCTTPTETAYLYTGSGNSCIWQTVTLRTKFVSQAEINGTGVAQNSSYGVLKYDDGRCSSSYPPGANQSNSLLKVSSVTGQCNVTLVGGDSVATNPGPFYANPYTCGDNLELVNSSNQNKYLKHIEDQCANTSLGCADGHMDNYSSVQGCSGKDVGDLPGSPYWTVDDK